MIVHVETPGGEVLVSGEIKFSLDGRCYANLHTHDCLWSHGANATEALENLANNLETIAAHIRRKANQ